MRLRSLLSSLLLPFLGNFYGHEIKSCYLLWMKILIQNLVEWLGSRLQKMSRHEPADWLQCWDLSGKFCRWSCWETKNWNIIICFLSAAYGGWSERLQPLPPQLPIPTNLKKWHQKTYFQTKFVLKGYKWGLSICAVSPQSSHKDWKKVEISPNLLNILQLRHGEAA